MEKKKEAKSKREFVVPIKWNIPDNMITPFATNMLVQLIKNEFKISFFEIQPAIRFDASEPPPSSVPANHIASVIVTADRLQDFIKALQTQLDSYNSRKQTK
jgi:hypothetical protein